MSIQNQTYKRLIVDELRTTLTQDLTIEKKTVLERILPHLYVQGSPSGTVTLRVKKGPVILTEVTLNIATAMTQAGKTKANYHGFVSFQFPKPPILKPDTYTVELEATTYSYDDNTFIGWVKLPSAADQESILLFPHDLRIVEIRTP